MAHIGWAIEWEWSGEVEREVLSTRERRYAVTGQPESEVLTLTNGCLAGVRRARQA